MDKLSSHLIAFIFGYLIDYNEPIVNLILSNKIFEITKVKKYIENCKLRSECCFLSRTFKDGLNFLKMNHENSLRILSEYNLEKLIEKNDKNIIKLLNNNGIDILKLPVVKKLKPNIGIMIYEDNICFSIKNRNSTNDKCKNKNNIQDFLITNIHSKKWGDSSIKNEYKRLHYIMAHDIQLTNSYKYKICCKNCPFHTHTFYYLILEKLLKNTDPYFVLA